MRCTTEQLRDWRAAADRAGAKFPRWVIESLDQALDLTGVAERLERRTTEVRAQRDDPGLIRKTHLEPEPRVQTHKFKPDFKKGMRP